MLRRKDPWLSRQVSRKSSLYLQKFICEPLYLACRVSQFKSLPSFLSLPQLALPSSTQDQKKDIGSPGGNHRNPPNGANRDTGGPPSKLGLSDPRLKERGPSMGRLHRINCCPPSTFPGRPTAWNQYENVSWGSFLWYLPILAMWKQSAFIVKGLI